MKQFCDKLQQAVMNSPYSDKVIVFGEGKQNPRIMMIGEAPGGDEEKQKRPFVGKAGKNLSEFLKVVGLEREEIYISNVVKLRPIKLSPKTGNPVNRPPSKDEIAFFLPYLQEEIKIADPEWIVTLGNVPLQAVTAIITAKSHHYLMAENCLHSITLRLSYIIVDWQKHMPLIWQYSNKN